MLDFLRNKKLCTVNKCLFLFYRISKKDNEDKNKFHDNIYSVLITLYIFDMTIVHALLRSYTVMNIPYDIH